MLSNMFTIHDNKAQVYMRPFFFSSDAEAVRSFGDLCNDAQSLCGKHPADFTLFAIGQFDDQSGNLETAAMHRNLGNGIDFQTDVYSVNLTAREKPNGDAKRDVSPVQSGPVR